MGWPKWLAAPALALALGLGLGIAAVLPQATAQQEDQQQEQQDQDEQSDAKDDDAAGQAEDCEDHGARGAFFETAAETIGITTDELRSELEAGESLAQVAQDHGVSTETLTNALLKEMNDKLDAAVADGDLTQAEADEKKADATEHIADIINQEGLPDHGPGHHGHESGWRGSGDADDDTQAEESSFERA